MRDNTQKFLDCAHGEEIDRRTLEFHGISVAKRGRTSAMAIGKLRCVAKGKMCVDVGVRSEAFSWSRKPLDLANGAVD